MRRRVPLASLQKLSEGAACLGGGSIDSPAKRVGPREISDSCQRLLSVPRRKHRVRSWRAGRNGRAQEANLTEELGYVEIEGIRSTLSTYATIMGWKHPIAALLKDILGHWGKVTLPE